MSGNSIEPSAVVWHSSMCRNIRKLSSQTGWTVPASICGLSLRNSSFSTYSVLMTGLFTYAFFTVSTLLSFIIRGPWKDTEGGRGLLLLVLVAVFLLQLCRPTLVVLYAQPMGKRSNVIHLPSGSWQVPEGNGSTWGFQCLSLRLADGLSAIALARSALIREGACCRAQA